MTLGAHKQRALVALLATRPNEVVSSDELIESLWSGSAPPTAAATLQVYVSRIRKVLEPERTKGTKSGVLVSQAPGYLLSIDPGRVDAQRFQSLANEARRRAHTEDPAAAASILREALELWRGAALAEFVYEPWAQGEAARLEELRLVALEDRIDADLASGQHGELVAEVESFAAEHPLRERLHAHLMLALYRSGRQAEALAAYQSARTKLTEELGLDPSPELQELNRRILTQDSTLAAPERASATTTVTSNLPTPPTGFVGRERELAAVVALLSRDDVRLASLTGPGGTGKTRLALQVAAESRDAFPAGVFWVGLAPLRDPMLVPSAMTQALGVQEQPGREPVDVLCERLAGKRLLVLLDNAEHLLPDLARTVSQVHAVAGPTVLVTSRERLNVAGEHAYAVPELDAHDAVALFLARAEEAGVELERTAIVDELCARLERLPLALELGAARTVVFTPEQLLDRLSQRLDLLKGGRDTDPRQRTLRATIEWSYELLDAEEQRLFRALSVFVGGCTYEAAEQVAGAIPDTLQSLLDKSLLRRRETDPAPRYWMLETIREYAADLGEQQLVRERHGTWLLELVRGLGTGLRRMDPEALACVAPERANFAQAIAWSLDIGPPDVAHELVARLSAYWFFTGAASEGLAHGERLLEADVGGSDVAHFSCLVALSELYGHTGDTVRGIELKERALRMLENLGDEPIPAATANFTKDEAAAMILKDLAQLYAGEGDLDTARAVADQAITRAKGLGNDLYIAHTVYAKGIVEFHSGRYSEARELFEESLPNWINVASVVDVAGTHLMVGECLRREGRCTEALDELRRGLEFSLEAGDLSILPETIQEFAAVAVVLGQPGAGAALLGSSERLRREMELPLWDPSDYERTSTALRDQLGDEVFEAEHARGAALTDDEAIDLARSIA